MKNLNLLPLTAARRLLDSTFSLLSLFCLKGLADI
jgi:hypothetical protein